MRVLGAAIGGVLLAVFVACSGGGGSSPTAPPSPPPPPPSPGQDSLAIVALEPASGSTLAEGVFLLVEARLSYHFAQTARGRLAFTVVCSYYDSLTCLDAGTLADLPAADGEIAVRVGLKPMGNAVRLTFGLVPERTSRTTAQAGVSYAVE